MGKQPFKLLHLPALALQNVLQFLNPIEMFELSQCSLKATSIIPLSGSKKFKLKLNHSFDCITVNDHIFRVYRDIHKSKFPPRGTRSFMETTVDVSHVSDYELISYWDDHYIGMATVLFQMSKVFSCPIERLLPYKTMPAEVFMSIIEFVSSKQSEIKELRVNADSLSYDNLTKIFDKLTVTDSLELEMDFRTSKDPNIPFTAKSITISHSIWITAVHLNAMKHCVVIELSRTTLTNVDMKAFLENWKSGEYPNLEYLSIESIRLTDNFTVFNLPSLQDTVNPHFFKKTVLNTPRVIYAAIDIQRADGVAAKIQFDVKKQMFNASRPSITVQNLCILHSCFF